MLITKEISISWNYNNKEHFESLGYKFTKMNEKFLVSVQHLKRSSNLEIKIKFDCCERIIPRRYVNHYQIKNGDFESPDICVDCSNKYKVEKTKQLSLKRKNRTLTMSDKGYWSVKSNRLLSLDNYIKTKGTLENILHDDIGKKIYHNIQKRESFRDCIIELGYEPDSLGFQLRNVYDDFSLIEEKIKLFINENNRFPSKNEIVKKLGIDQRYIDKNGGIYELKRKMQYFDKDDLVDDRLFINLSLLEFIVAQYLIFHNVHYTRERNIPYQGKRKYRYDFHIPDCDTFVEVWGFRSEGKGWSTSYGEKRKNKEHIYAENNLKLISIEIDDINVNDLDYTIANLDKIFSGIVDTNMFVPHSIFKSNKIMSNEEINNIILSHRNVSTMNYPLASELNDIGLGYIVRIIRKRFGTYRSFINNLKNSTTQSVS